MRSIRLWSVIALTLALAGGLAPMAYAAEVDAFGQHLFYHGNPVKKLGRGIANVCLGWVELPLHVGYTAANEGQAAGASLGMLRGLGMAAARTLTGAFEVVTFPLPNAGQRGYAPLMEPEYVDLGNLI